MTIKFHRPNIRIPNPLSAAKSAVRAVKHKLQPSGSKHDLTKVRSENPGTTNGRAADAAAATAQPQYQDTESCLRFLANSKDFKANFYSQAFEATDKLTELCFQANTTCGGYNAVEKRILQDFAVRLKNYDAGGIKNISKQAKKATQEAFMGNADRITVNARTRMMKGIIKECAECLKDLKKNPASPAGVSTAPATPVAPPAKQEPELSFRDPPVRDAAPDAPPVPPQQPSESDAAHLDRKERIISSRLVGDIFVAVTEHDAADYIEALQAFLRHVEETGGDAAARIAAVVAEESPEVQQQLQQAFVTRYGELRDIAHRLGSEDVDYTPDYYYLAQSLAMISPNEAGMLIPAFHREGATRLLTDIRTRDFPAFVRNLDEIGKLAPDERAKRVEAVKLAFRYAPPESGDTEAMKRTMSAFFAKVEPVATRVKKDQLWTTWRELQAVPQLREGTPVKARETQAAQRNPDLVAAAKMIGAINRGDFNGFLECLGEFHELQHKSTGEIIARYAQMKYAFENRPPANAQLNVIKSSMASFLKNPALLRKHQPKIDELKRAWLTVQTFFPEANLPRATPVVDRLDFEDSINWLDIPKFLRTLHAIGQVNDPTKRDELYTAIEAADFSEELQRFAIERLDALMRSVAERLTRDKDFDVQSRQRIEGICRTWLDLKSMNPALHPSSRQALPKEDLKLAKEILAALLQAPART